MTSSKNIRYIPAIDHLRAYAALLVLLFHVGYRPGAPWPVASNSFKAIIYEGHTGVALFLVLSGFIFTYGSAGREIDYKTFLVNRILRIYPLMIALIMIGISAFGDRLSVTQVIEALLPVQNIHGNVPTLPLDVFNAVFWTISVEFQFYLIFPFLYRQLIHRGISGLLPLMAFLWLARWSTFLLGANSQVVAYFTILGRLDQFLIGMIAATFARRLTLDSRLLRWALPLGVAGLVAALYLYNQAGGLLVAPGWKVFWPPVEGALWALIILGYLTIFHGRNGFVSKVIAGVGTVSYSMYLLHVTVMTILVNHGFKFRLHGWPVLSDLVTGLMFVYPVALLVSILSYHAIEKPFLGLRRKYLEPGTNAQAAPAPVAAVTGDRAEEGIPGVEWLVAGLACFCAVVWTTTVLVHRAHLQRAADAAILSLRKSIEPAIGASRSNHPSTCKVLLMSGDDASLLMDVGQQLAQAGESFVVPGRWQNSFGAEHRWQNLNAKTLGEGLSPWYLVPRATSVIGVAADTSGYSLRPDARSMVTPPPLELSAADSTAEINFVRDGNAGKFVLGGWSVLEPEGTWTEDTWAALAFHPQVVKGTNVEVFLDALPMLVPGRGLIKQGIRLYFNGTLINPEQQLSAAGTAQFTIPAATWNLVAGKVDAQVSLAFELPDSAAPVDLDPTRGNNDRRKLGLFVSKVRLRVTP